MMNRFSTFSAATAPICLGKQTVRFAPEMVKYIQEHGCYPCSRDGRGDYLHLQFLFSNGAKTASFSEDKAERNPKYLDNIKLYFDGKTEGDGYMLKITFDEIRKMDKRYKELPAEEILNDLLAKEFTVYFYRYNSNGKGYLQVAWSADQYAKHTGKKQTKKTAAKAVEEEDLPFEV